MFQRTASALYCCAFLLAGFQPPVWADSSLGYLQEMREGLRNLQATRVVVKVVSSPATFHDQIGTNTNDLKSQVIVSLRAKIPELTVVDNASDTLTVGIILRPINVTKDGTIGFYGLVTLHIWRSTTVLATGRARVLPVWNIEILFEGTKDKAVSRIREIVEDGVTQFAAEWRQAKR